MEIFFGIIYSIIIFGLNIYIPILFYYFMNDEADDAIERFSGIIIILLLLLLFFLIGLFFFNKHATILSLLYINFYIIILPISAITLLYSLRHIIEVFDESYVNLEIEICIFFAIVSSLILIPGIFFLKDKKFVELLITLNYSIIPIIIFISRCWQNNEPCCDNFEYIKFIGFIDSIIFLLHTIFFTFFILQDSNAKTYLVIIFVLCHIFLLFRHIVMYEDEKTSNFHLLIIIVSFVVGILILNSKYDDFYKQRYYIRILYENILYLKMFYIGTLIIWILPALSLEQVINILFFILKIFIIPIKLWFLYQKLVELIVNFFEAFTEPFTDSIKFIFEVIFYIISWPFKLVYKIYEKFKKLPIKKKTKFLFDLIVKFFIKIYILLLIILTWPVVKLEKYLFKTKKQRLITTISVCTIGIISIFLVLFWPQSYESLKKEILNDLKSYDLDILSNTKNKIRNLGHKKIKILPDLIKLAKDKRNRYFITECIAEIGPKTLPGLKIALEDKNFIVRRIAVNSMSKIGSPSVNYINDLIYLYEDENNEKIRIEIIECFGNIGSSASQAIPLLLKNIKRYESKEIKIASAKALGQIGIKSLPAIFIDLENNNKEIKKYTKYFFNNISKDDYFAIPTLIKYLKSKKIFIRLHVIRILEKISYNAQAIIPNLAFNLNSSVYAERIATLKAIKSIGSSNYYINKKLKKFLLYGKTEEKIITLEIISKIKDDFSHIIPYLKIYLEGDDLVIKEKVIETLGCIATYDKKLIRLLIKYKRNRYNKIIAEKANLAIKRIRERNNKNGKETKKSKIKNNRFHLKNIYFIHKFKKFKNWNLIPTIKNKGHFTIEFEIHQTDKKFIRKNLANDTKNIVFSRSSEPNALNIKERKIQDNGFYYFCSYNIQLEENYKYSSILFDLILQDANGKLFRFSFPKIKYKSYNKKKLTKVSKEKRRDNIESELEPYKKYSSKVEVWIATICLIISTLIGKFVNAYLESKNKGKFKWKITLILLLISITITLLINQILPSILTSLFGWLGAIIDINFENDIQRKT